MRVRTRHSQPPVLCTILLALSTSALLCATSLAQSSGGESCEASAPVKAALKSIYAEDAAQPQPPVSVAQQKRVSALRELLSNYPQDFFVIRALQDATHFRINSEAAPLIDQYRQNLAAHPDDPSAMFFYGRLLIGRRTPEAISLLEKVLEKDPRFPWAHQALAEAYRVPRYRDKAKALEHLDKFMQMCPANLDAYWSLIEVDDKDLLAKKAQDLKRLLESRANPDDISYYNLVWQLSFRALPPPQHAALRTSITQDLQKIRGLNLNSERWLQVLRDGYRQANDEEGLRWVESQIVEKFPNSYAAKEIVKGEWRKAHPYPVGEVPQEKRDAFYRALLDASREWTRRWPDDTMSWLERFGAVNSLKDVPEAEALETVDKLMGLLDRDPGAVYSFPPTPISIAEFYLKRNIRLERVPALIESGMKEVEDRVRRKGESDWAPAGGRNDDELTLRYTHWTGWPLLAKYYIKTKQMEQARRTLDSMRKELERSKPKEGASSEEKNSYRWNESTYWRWAAEAAQAEGRRLDALAFYRTALTVRPPSARTSTKAEPDEVEQQARSLWKELGGGEEGWTALLLKVGDAEKGVKAEETANGLWEKKDKPLQPFDLYDLQGRAWKAADLKGKVAVINVWATWCGPCQSELPFVQKLHERLKDRKDVVVLTLNMDNEVGLVEPYVKEKKYTFPVLPAFSYVNEMMDGMVSIPRLWVVDENGIIRQEQIGFGNEGEKWIEQTLEMVQRASVTKSK